MKFFVEIEIRGPLEADLRASGTVEGCLMIEKIVRHGFLAEIRDDEQAFLTVRAMEHVTVPTGRVP